MDFRLSKIALIALLGRYTTAAVLTAPAASTTAAPLVARDVLTLGYQSITTYAETTIWDTVTAVNAGYVISTSDTLYNLCESGTPCTYWSCSGDWLVSASTSYSCGDLTSTCSSWILARDVWDQSRLTNYWCDTITKTGGTIYIRTPTRGESAPPTSAIPDQPSTNSAEPTTDFPVTSNASGLDNIIDLDPSDAERSIVATLPTSSDSESSPDPKSESSTPIGAIAGGAVGGVALLAGIIFGVFCCLRRKRKNGQTQQQQSQYPQHPPQPPMQQQQQQQHYPPPQQFSQQQMQAMSAPQFYDPNANTQHAYYAPEKAPHVASTQMNSPYYPAHGGQSTPVSPVQLHSNPSPVPFHSQPSPVPQGVNELPAERN